jgi:signal transduction histidine kinase
VKDNGVGIKEADQKKLFKLFGFLNTTKQLNAQGIGLGLYISKQLALAFDGDVSV